MGLMLAGSVILGTLLNLSELLVPRKLYIIIHPGYYLMVVKCLIVRIQKILIDINSTNKTRTVGKF